MSEQPYFDEEMVGTRNAETGEQETFPLSLVQQIDIGIKTGRDKGQITFCITAECNYAEWELDIGNAEKFVSTMEKALPEFDGAKARTCVSDVFSYGKSATIYVSPYYPDAGIFPKV